MKKYISKISIILLIILCGCTQNSEEHLKQIEDLESQATILETQISSLSAELSSQQETNKVLSAKYTELFSISTNLSATCVTFEEQNKSLHKERIKLLNRLHNLPNPNIDFYNALAQQAHNTFLRTYKKAPEGSKFEETPKSYSFTFSNNTYVVTIQSKLLYPNGTFHLFQGDVEILNPRYDAEDKAIGGARTSISINDFKVIN